MSRSECKFFQKNLFVFSSVTSAMSAPPIKSASAPVGKQSSENWLNPACRTRVTCHEITWVDGDAFNYMQAGGGLYFHSIPRSGTMPHSHDFVEVLLVSNGGLRHRVNENMERAAHSAAATQMHRADDTSAATHRAAHSAAATNTHSAAATLEAGDICFLRPDDFHSFAPDDSHAKVEILMFDFDAAFLKSLGAYFGDGAFLRRYDTPALPPVFRLDTAALSSLYTKLLRFNSPAGNDPSSAAIKTKALICDLFSKFFADDPAPPGGVERIPRWLEVLCTAMSTKENFTEGLPRLCALAYRSPGHVCKAFRKHLGKSPTEFINDLRLNHAAWQLADTNTDILEIANDLNFQSLSRFYALFRKKYGVAPAAYRRMHSPEKQF
ncbi:MAG: helix-turn-helix transcriptional regulator [Kiritimatiellaeota bacterium]|nr:helix-turn-helix transcriptional regulator [Kiritimatiellota bacterium]